MIEIMPMIMMITDCNNDNDNDNGSDDNGL